MSPRLKGFQLARIFGIRVTIGLSGLIALFVSIFYLQYELGGRIPDTFAVTVLTALSFFGSIVLHELGHALTAKRAGMHVSEIQLWALGGVTKTSGGAQTAGWQFAVAVAGPMATAVVIAVCGALSDLAAPHQTLFSFAVEVGPHASPLGVWLKMVAILNLFLLALNLIPAFPLDGGQIAQAAIWKLTGDRNLAIRITGRIGQAFALAIGLLGMYLLTQRDSWGFWLALIAMFVYQGAGTAVLHGTIGQRVDRLTVADVMDRKPIVIPAQSTLLDAKEQFFGAQRWPWFPVVDPSSRFLGLLRVERVDAELAAGRPALQVIEAIDDDDLVRIVETQPLESVLRSEAIARFGGMVAVDGDGMLRGVVTLTQLHKALRLSS